MLEPIGSIRVDKPQPLNARLSPREMDVLKLLVDGYSNKEIAIALYLSPNTIKTHVRSIMNKLGVEHRLQAVILALRHNLV